MFDAAPSWATSFDFNGALSEFADHALVIDLAEGFAGDAYAGIQVPALVATNRIYRTRIVDVPLTPNGETGLTLASSDGSHFTGLAFSTDRGMDTVVSDAGGMRSEHHDDVPLDAFWIQLVTTDSTVGHQVSTDGVEWREVSSMPSPPYVSNATLVLQAGTWDAVSAPGRASFDFLLECEPAS